MTPVVLDVAQPLDPGRARALINDIRASGFIDLGDHAVEEMEADELDMVDAANILRGGQVLAPEWEHGEWRYRIESARMVFVIAFESESKLKIVTAWRKKK
jgi:hypothetical protein